MPLVLLPPDACRIAAAVELESVRFGEAVTCEAVEMGRTYAVRPCPLGGDDFARGTAGGPSLTDIRVALEIAAMPDMRCAGCTSARSGNPAREDRRHACGHPPPLAQSAEHLNYHTCRRRPQTLFASPEAMIADPPITDDVGSRARLLQRLHVSGWSEDHPRAGAALDDADDLARSVDSCAPTLARHDLLRQHEDRVGQRLSQSTGRGQVLGHADYVHQPLCDAPCAGPAGHTDQRHRFANVDWGCLKR